MNENEIEKRAYAIYPIIKGDNTINDAGWDGYVRGANDQQEIDINRAIEWIKYNNENGGCLFDGWEESLIEQLKYNN